MTSATSSSYAARLSIGYPDRELDRLSTGLRFLYIIPIGIVLAGLGGAAIQFSNGRDSFYFGAGAGLVGVLWAPTLLMIVFRQKYPRWWFDFSYELARFANRVGAYFALMSDEYPSTTDEQYVHLELDYPDAENKLERWAPLYKWILAIPHYIVLFILWIGVFVVGIAAWFAILFTGRYPRSFFDFIEGVMRWSLRVNAYMALLITDDYPPFSME